MKWVSAFSYLPVNYSVRLAEAADQTQRITFDNNLNGKTLRLCLSNRWSKSPLTLAKVTVGKAAGNGVRGVLPVTRDGSSRITLAPGEECWSDEVALSVQPGERLAIQTYVDQTQSIESICAFWAPTGPMVELSAAGDFTDGSPFDPIPAQEVYPVIRADANKGYFFYGVSGLQVLTDDDVKTVVLFGDSITHMSYVSNPLTRRLYAAYPGKVTVLNRGSGGNRLLHNATRVDFLPAGGACFGTAGIMRFEKDVFGQENADVVVVLEGINDIMHPIQFQHPDEIITPEELICGLRYLTAITRKHGARIFGATITPCGNDEYPGDWLPQFESVRLETNRRIRAGIGYDGWFDYDAAVRDNARPGYMLKECHIGDGLHPNNDGGERMAAQVDLAALMA